MQYWLLKTEPSDFSWADLEIKKIEVWDGVHNHQAQQNMKKMKIGDKAFFYHTGKEKAIVGITKICKEFYYLPFETKFGVVDVEYYCKLNKQIKLSSIKCEPKLKELSILKQQRLSVAPIRPEEWDLLINMSI